MFCKDLLKDWPTSHLLDYGWYFDYFKDCTPTSKISFCEINEPRFQYILHPLQLLRFRHPRKKKHNGEGTS
jgi:hypothetical protein